MIIETIEVAPARARQARGSATLWGATLLLVRRRAWRDRAHLGASIAIVALSTVLALGGPQVVLATIDDGAKDAVTAAGSDANIDVIFPVGNPDGDVVTSLPGIDPATFDSRAAAVPNYLPGVVAPLIEGYTGAVKSKLLAISNVVAPVPDDASLADVDQYNASDNLSLFIDRTNTFVQFAMADLPDVTIAEGRLPEDPSGDGRSSEVTQDVRGTEVTRLDTSGEVIEIAVSRSVADTLEIGLGSIVRVRNAAQESVLLHVVGVFDAASADDPFWGEYPEALTPLASTRTAPPSFRATIVVSPAVAEVISSQFQQPFEGRVTLAVGSTGLTLQGAKDVAAAMKDLESTAASLLPDAGVGVTIESGLGPALERYPARARAALAQMSVMIAGVVGVAAVTIALMARLLLGRRRNDISLERARGASVPSIALRLGIESLVFTVVGLALGSVIARLLVGEVPLTSGPTLLVAAVSLASAPVLGAAMARGTWTGRRVAANRQDRAKATRAKAARRWTLDILAVTVAALGVATLRGRGVLQTQTEGVDPFLAAAPGLLALGTTIIVLRAFPVPMRIIQFFARRTAGVGGVITLAKARGKIAVLPLVALTLAVSIAVSGGLLVATVRAGQTQASWERVGGDVRVEAAIDDGTAAELEDQGLTVSRVLAIPESNLEASTSYLQPYLLAVEPNYPDIAAASGLSDADDIRALMAAAEAWVPGEPIPALASYEVIRADFDDDSQMYLGRTWIDITFVGELETKPDGWANAPYVMLPLELLRGVGTSEEIVPSLAFVQGPDALAIVSAEQSIPDSAIESRAGWLDGVRGSALIGGVERMMTMAVIAVALLAAVSLLVTVLDGVRDRGLALAMLRTQGMGGGYGWWLALGELLPLTTAGVIGGTVGGLAILLLLGRALGLEVLAGGITAPPPVADPVFLGVVGVGVVLLLFIAVSLEVSTQRRTKLSEVLRLGETR